MLKRIHGEPACKSLNRKGLTMPQNAARKTCYAIICCMRMARKLQGPALCSTVHNDRHRYVPAWAHAHNVIKHAYVPERALGKHLQLRKTREYTGTLPPTLEKNSFSILSFYHTSFYYTSSYHTTRKKYVFLYMGC